MRPNGNLYNPRDVSSSIWHFSNRTTLLGYFTDGPPSDPAGYRDESTRMWGYLRRRRISKRVVGSVLASPGRPAAGSRNERDWDGVRPFPKREHSATGLSDSRCPASILPSPLEFSSCGARSRGFVVSTQGRRDPLTETPPTGNQEDDGDGDRNSPGLRSCPTRPGRNACRQASGRRRRRT